MELKIESMISAKLEQKYDFQPLRQYLLLAKNEGWKGMRIRKNFLLSRLINLDRDVVERLELAGIYDSDEFFSIKDEIVDYLGIGEERMNAFTSIIEAEVRKNENKPIIDLEMKEKFCFVTTASDKDNNALALISDGILFLWSNPVEDGWSLVKYVFDKTFELLERPELLSCLNNDDFIPSWLQLEEITTYIGSLDPMKDVYSQAEELGFPNKPKLDSAMELAESKVLKLKFVYELAIQHRIKKNKLFT